MPAYSNFLETQHHLNLIAHRRWIAYFGKNLIFKWLRFLQYWLKHTVIPSQLVISKSPFPWERIFLPQCFCKRCWSPLKNLRKCSQSWITPLSTCLSIYDTTKLPPWSWEGILWGHFFQSWLSSSETIYFFDKTYLMEAMGCLIALEAYQLFIFLAKCFKPLFVHFAQMLRGQAAARNGEHYLIDWQRWYFFHLPSLAASKTGNESADQLIRQAGLAEGVSTCQNSRQMAILLSLRVWRLALWANQAIHIWIQITKIPIIFSKRP